MSETKWSQIATKASPIPGTDQLLIIDNGVLPIANKLISISQLPVGETNTASNLGTGTGFFAQKNGVDLEFKSLTGTANNIVITSNMNEVNLDVGTSIVQTDQSNTFGNFTQIFTNDTLEIQDSTGLLNYQIMSGTIGAAGSIQIMLPSLSVNDEFVTKDFAQTLTNKTLTTPTISDFSNANHDHSNAAGGGNLSNNALATGVFTNITGIGIQTQALDMGSSNIENSELPTDTNFFVDSTDETKKIAFNASNITTATTRTITLPDSSVTLVSTTDGLIDLVNIKPLSSGQIISSNGTTTVSVGAGTTGQVLTSAGASGVPSFQDLPTTPVADGGTGLTSITSGAVLIGNGSSPLTVTPVPTGSIMFGNAGVATIGALTGDLSIDNTGITSLRPFSCATSQIQSSTFIIITINTVGVFEPIGTTSWSTSIPSTDFTVTTAGLFTYTGSVTRLFKIDYFVAGEENPAGGSDRLAMGLLVNGTINNASEFRGPLGGTLEAAKTFVLSLQQNDTIQLAVANLGTTDNVGITDVGVTITEFL